MRRLSLALLVSLGWLAAAGGSCLALLLFGPGLATWSLVIVLLLLATGTAVMLQRRADAADAARLARLGEAVGLAVADAGSMEAIVANLCQRLDRANQFKTAFAALKQPAAVVGPTGEILGASAGLKAIAPRVVEGEPAAGLLGEGAALPTFDGRITLARRQFLASELTIGGDRRVVEFVPAGGYVSDDDLDRFTNALVSGNTSFRFDRAAIAASPILRVLESALEDLDGSLLELVRLAEGGEADPATLRRNSGLSPLVAALSDRLGAVEDARAEEAETRAGLERKLGAVLAAIDRYRANATSMGELAGRAQGDMGTVAQTFSAVGGGTAAMQQMQRDATALARDAAKVVQRAQTAVTDVDNSTAEIDRMVAAIEDVSFRTNLLALNAAVEAARAGERGAGFAVVADEVRMLAQATQKTAREIRMLVGTTRAQSTFGTEQTQHLENILTGLGRHLENVSNETDKIAAAFAEGQGAANRLNGTVRAVGEQAEQALQLPRRRSA